MSECYPGVAGVRVPKGSLTGRADTAREVDHVVALSDPTMSDRSGLLITVETTAATDATDHRAE
jgi:hypothetical protein